jgi:hypothetical protein
VRTRYGRAVARLVTHLARMDRSQARAVIEPIRSPVSEIKPERFDWTLPKVDRDAGPLSLILDGSALMARVYAEEANPAIRHELSSE